MTRTAKAGRALAATLSISLLSAPLARSALLSPSVDSFYKDANGDTCLLTSVPPGFRHAVLQRYNVATGQWENLIAGGLNGATNAVTFVDSVSLLRAIYRVVAGESTTVPAAALTGAPHFSTVYNGSTGPILGNEQIGHVMNRIAYGPTATEFSAIESEGVVSYIDAQLDPASIDESGNSALNDSIADLFHSFVPGTGTIYTGDGSTVTYFKGTAEPPAEWTDLSFDDSGWASTTMPVGYGTDLDYADPLTDMRQTTTPPVPGYVSFYTRQEFEIAAPAALDNFFLDIQYDDAFVAYLNGTEIARSNISDPGSGVLPAFDQASDAEGGNFDYDNESAFAIDKGSVTLNAGTNVLAIQIHNTHIANSSDAGVLAQIADFPDSPYVAIRGARELQQLIHLRGIYSARQLQAVLGEFWENHFTTDFDKVEDYLLNLDEYEAAADVSQSAEDMIDIQAEMEAARIEWEEYEFFYDNALGYFGDLLLFSASSPSMLIYLDNVLNTAAQPNENYAREILELGTFGADNGYDQTDIEELSKCFTGWTVRKVWPGNKLAFPTSARTPPINGNITIASETVELDLGPGWKYLKGTAEPTTDGMGAATIDWAQPAFDDGAWLDGASGFGYADGDDATVLSDMRADAGATPPVPGYMSVYLRRDFTLDLSAGDQLVMEIDFDDGYVAYLNGTEIHRRGLNGTPPPYMTIANSHSSVADGGTPQTLDLSPHLGLLKDIGDPDPVNVLAIQVHNAGLSSSDLTMRPRIFSRTYTSDSIAATETSGLWAFRFDPDQHNLDAKTLFPGSSYQVNIPADRLGAAGVNDAIDVIDAMVTAQPCAEFICLKLVNRFVSDEISLDTYQDRSAPPHLLEVMDNAVAAWFSTSPRKGHIGTVMRAVLDLDNLTGAFWRESSKRGKVKNPVEFINSAYRALDALVESDLLPNRTRDMGMTLFQRDEPDGYDELGLAWTDTQSLLERMRFCQALASNRGYGYGDWNIAAWLAAYGLGTDVQLLDHFDELLFQGTLGAEQRAVISAFMNTNELGAPSDFNSLSGNSLINRVEATVGLLLSSPEFQFQ